MNPGRTGNIAMKAGRIAKTNCVESCNAERDREVSQLKAEYDSYIGSTGTEAGEDKDPGNKFVLTVAIVLRILATQGAPPFGVELLDALVDRRSERHFRSCSFAP